MEQKTEPSATAKVATTPAATTAEPTLKSFLEAGIHFGHQTRRWNPRMRKYIFTQRNGIHIIDLQQTIVLLNKACAFLKEVAVSGQKVLFVGTKKQAQEAIALEAQRCHMFYVNQRWLGGTLTNFATIQARIDYLVRLEDAHSRGELERLPKKEALKLGERIQQLNRQMGGIKEMTEMPGVMFIIDPVKEKNAVAEAKRVGIPIVAVCDTDANPNEVDYPIPGNDDAIRAVKLFCARVADAILEGQALRPSLAEVVSQEEGKVEGAELPGGEMAFSPEPEAVKEQP